MRETSLKKTAMTMRHKRSWLLPLALLGALGCTNDGVEEPAPPVQEDVQVTAWVPGTPPPSHTHVEGTEHSLVMDWVREEGSIEDLTDHSALVVRGQVESTRFDVMRAHAQSKVEGQPTGEASGAYSDLPVVIATVRIDDIARASAGLKSASGGVVAQGATVDVVFPGGLLSDGCMLAPADNPLPKMGERAVYFLTPQGGDKPVAASARTELYSVTGGPLGRVLVQDGLAQGGPVDALFARVEARARSVQYLGPDTHVETFKPDPGTVTAQNWCGLVSFGYRWCRRPANITFTDYTSTRWPVGDAMNAWMYTSISNSLYLHWRASGASDVMVYEAWYGATGWAGYATNSWSGACMTRSTLQLNNSYHSGAHYAKTVSIHEVGHSLGLAHHGNCNSIMYSSPTQCAATTTTCDAQAAAELYPY
ncbi:matrixin family metalloprotease [Myxococcus qinghaiensis]|uniref:matrixin family metalloprotease n=1 Tax=Myxococcus qinghaiensis TaxID=2906758 RepID=UPI0020A72E2F|nr:matrixin family metalloprotease [Myxococcus qinghaiensis]MCP3166043.1 matrixin family metalloprotease [Myxococcus qinghaiensis]